MKQKNNIDFLQKFRVLSNGNKFLLLLLFNTLFFSLFAYLLPLRFEENDDVIMCMIASGVYSGVPDAHLIFINYLYGWFLTVFYNAFPSIEWYTISFCVIHVVSLTVIVHSILKRVDKSIWLKITFLLLLYVIEIKIILLFQFTTTAAIGSFAGLLLLFETKKIYKISGVFLFLIGALVRFDAAMLVLLLMLPIFIYEVFEDRKKIIKMFVPVTICICGAFAIQIVNNHIYDKNQEWAYYKEYNAIRGRINDNPNAGKIMDKLPDGISKNDYQLLLDFFPDAQVINLSKIKDLNGLMQKIPFVEKVKNIYPSLRKYTLILGLIVMLFFLCFWAEKQNKNKIYFLFYLMFFIGILSYISMEGSLKYRVFITALFPVLYFLYKYSPQFFDKKMKIGYAGVIVILSLILLNRTCQIRELNNGYEKMVINEQLPIMNEIRNKNVSAIPVATDFSFEYFCSPFIISKIFGEFSLMGTGWLTNIPFNKERFDSFMSFVENDTYIFISSERYKWYIPAIQETLIENYGCNTEVVEKFSNKYYLMIQFKEK